MFNEEIDMTLECAVKIRKHLVRLMERTNDEAIASKLQYVNNLIMEADSMQYEVMAVA